MNTHSRNETRRPFVTRTEFGMWLACAEPGAILQYHDGFLALDVVVAGSRFSVNDRQELVDIAGYARWAGDDGMVHLVQRRIGPNRFAYLAVMRKKSSRQSALQQQVRPVSDRT